ncbi:MAG: amidohydrolase family protein [Planctomycetia bacterium]|nr:MAG: amidohydrolase family protein [Planctomycetia bacterium]
MIIDLHCHYTLTAARRPDIERFTFEPPGHASDSYIAPRALRRLSFRGLRRLLKIDPRLPAGDELDAALAAVYDRHLLAEGPIERFVLLAFDHYHAHDGSVPPPPRSRFARGGDIYTSNALVRDVCRRRPDRFLFGASVHPYRPNAAACVREVFAAGACLLKWLPLHQNIDIRDPRSVAVLRTCAELGLPVLAHYGEEFTLQTQHRGYEHVIDALDVLRALRRERAMPPFIVAHVATPVTTFGDDASWRMLCDALVGEFADAPLYADISALGTWGKAPYLWRVVDRPEVHSKLLFGSDFPVPLADPLLRLLVGRPYRRIAESASWPQRYAALCRHVGYNEIVLHRAAELLPNVGYFASVSSRP